MNFLQRWLSRALPAGPPVTYDRYFSDSIGTSTGLSVNEYTALNHSPVWSGVSQLAGDIAKLPLSHNRVLPNGGKEVFAGKLHTVLHDRPNPEMTSYKFREAMQALCLLYGNAFAEIIVDAAARTAGLYLIDPTRVAPERDRITGRLMYRVSQPSGGQVFVQSERMIHISSLSTDGIIGQSITEHAKESIGLGLAAEKFGASFYGNGATFGGVISVEQPLNGPQGEVVKGNIRSAIEAVHAGVERAHKILVLAGGAKFEARGTAPNQAQFLETRQFQIQEVARWLVMPPHKIGDLANAHFTNIEESEIQYWKGTVHRWIKMWEQELKTKLIPALEQNLQSIDFNMEGELRGTSTQRAAFYKEMHGLGVYTINMILEKENLPTIGPDGDRRLVPMNNAIPLDRLDDYVDSVIKKNEPAPAALPPKDEPKQIEGERFLALLEETRAESKRMADQVQAKIEQELRDYAEAAGKARRDQAAAEAFATAADVARVDAERIAEAVRERETTALVDLQQAREQLSEAIASRDQLQATAEERQVRIEAAADDVVTKIMALDEAHAKMREQLDAVQAAQDRVRQAEALASERSTEADQLRSELTSARAAHEAEMARAAAAEATIEEQQKAERELRARLVTSHRDLILDVVQRMARNEAARVRRHAHHPDQLRKWSVAYYDEQARGVGAELLYPAVRNLMTWKGSDEDPHAVARAMSDAYYEDSSRQVQAICDGMTGDEYQEAVTRMLTRWEHERPAMIADKVVQDEIAALVNR